MNKLLIATKNGHKLDEFKEIFGKESNVYSLFDFPDIPEIEETGHTFEENSQLKATTLFKYVKETTIADDSGLVVSSLDGAPGVYSARYSGPNANDRSNRRLLLENMVNVKDRSAYFECCIYLKSKNISRSFTGRLYGNISFEEKGINGFGYDSIFIPIGDTRTLAEYSEVEKNKISHRYLAIQELLKWKNTK